MKPTKPAYWCAFAFAAVALTANLESQDLRVLLFDDFSEYETGDEPGGNWEQHNTPVSKAFIREREDGNKALTMTNLDSFAVARTILHFDPPSEDTVVVEFEWNRLTDRAYENHEGTGLSSVPDIRLLAGAEGTSFGTSVFSLQFRSWDRTRWLWWVSEDETSDAVNTGSGDFLFDVPLAFRLHYTRSSGAVRIQVSRDGFQTVVYDEEGEAMPGLDINGLGIQSANRFSDDVIYADPVWDLGYVQVAVEGVPVIGSYEDWAAAFLSDYPEDSNRMDDAGEFGISNFTRYAFALDPLRPFEPPVREVGKLAEGEPFYFSFYRYEGIGDVIYALESAVDPAGPWEVHEPEEEVVTETVSLGDGIEEVVVSVLGEVAGRRFFRVRAGLPTALFYDDFSDYEVAEAPEGDWVHNNTQDRKTFIREREDGSKALTMTNLDSFSVARTIFHFDPPSEDTVVVEFEWNRLTDRAYENHEGTGLGGVPDIRLLADAEGTSFGTSVFALQFQSWDRTRWLWWVSEDETSDAVNTDSDDFLFDVPLAFRLHYTRSSGAVRIRVSRDGFQTVVYDEEGEAMPGLDINGLGIQSANRFSDDVIYADPVWDLGYVSVWTE